MSDYKDSLLTAILDCGYLDLAILEDCQYDFYNLVEECKANFGEISLNGIAMCMFDYARADMERSIEERIDDLKRDLSCYDDDYIDAEVEEMKDELEKLSMLNVSEDIESFHNYLDTSVYFVANEKIYKDYCQEELKRFSDDTGFDIN